MCFIDAYEKRHTIWNYNDSGSLKPLGLILNFIDSWLQFFEENYSQWTMMYREKMSEMFKNIPVNIPEPNPGDFKNKIQYMFIDIGVKWHIQKKNTKLPPLKRPRLGK